MANSVGTLSLIDVVEYQISLWSASDYVIKHTTFVAWDEKRF